MSTEEKGYEIKVSEDLLRVTVSLDPEKIAVADAVAAIVEEANELGVQEMPDPEQLTSELQEEHNEKGELSDVEICSGTPAVTSQDGWLEWARDFFSTEFVEDDFGRVNYRLRQGDPRVSEGELVATLHPEQEGKNGVDVYGNTLTVDPAKSAALNAGESVQVKTENGAYHFYAGREGRLRYGQDTLEVDDEYVIDGDVDVKTGHVSHPGTVIVRGDITPDSVVQAGGDLEVEGTIEEADVDIGGSLWVKEGITRTGEQPIRVGGMVTARYLRETTLEAGEDIAVANEIINSHVHTRGSIDLSKGRLTGGEAIALQGGTIAVVGSRGSVMTTLKAAVDPFLEKRIAPQRKEIKENQETIDKVYAKAGPKLENQKNLGAKEREAVTELLGRIAELEDAMEEAQEIVKAAEQDSENRARQAKTHLLKTVYPEVYIQVRDAPAQRVSKELQGPLLALARLVQDEDNPENNGRRVRLVQES